MKLLEKIVDKVLDNELYALGSAAFLFMFTALLCVFSGTAYKDKLDNEVILAKIAAGQVVDDKAKQ
jgi:hypothetical protein